MATSHTLVIGSCIRMQEIKDNSIHLIVTSPPYFNAPFDYEDEYPTYDDYLMTLKAAARESYRVLQEGRICALNIDDMLVKGEKYPITADATKIFQEAGFRYRDRIIWKKPDGYVRISRRSSVLIQNPYPMYFYPDNLLESIIIFQKGKFNYKSISSSVRDASKIDMDEVRSKRWYLALWNMTNVLPGSVLERGIAAFPYELPYRIIKLFSHVGETVLDPFAGSGTTALAARRLQRNSIGYELRSNLVDVYKKKIGFERSRELFNQEDQFNLIYQNKGNVE